MAVRTCASDAHRGRPFAACVGARAGPRWPHSGIGPRSDAVVTSRPSRRARNAGRNGRAITPAPIGRCASRARRAGWARAVCAGGFRGSRVARPTVRRRSASAAIDCRSRCASIASGSGRATGLTPVSRSVRSALPCAVPRCAWGAVSGALLTVASMAGSSARPATSSTATRRARASDVGRSRRCSEGRARPASSVRGSLNSPRALAPASLPRSLRFSAISRGRRTPIR